MSLGTVLLYALAPALGTLCGGLCAAVRRPSDAVSSVVQHFAAGVVFAAVAIELLPQLTRSRELMPMVGGFCGGVALMLAIRGAIVRLQGEGAEPKRRNPLGLVAATGIDVGIDGLMVGVSFAAGPREGAFITLALTVELLFAGLAAASSLLAAGHERSTCVGVTAAMAVLVIFGATLGGTLFAGLAGAGLVAVLAFATSSMLYLVTEELLKEAHEAPETSLATTMFFVGFLALMVIEMRV